MLSKILMLLFVELKGVNSTTTKGELIFNLFDSFFSQRGINEEEQLSTTEKSLIFTGARKLWRKFFLHYADMSRCPLILKEDVAAAIACFIEVMRPSKRSEFYQQLLLFLETMPYIDSVDIHKAHERNYFGNSEEKIVDLLTRLIWWAACYDYVMDET